MTGPDDPGADYLGRERLGGLPSAEVVEAGFAAEMRMAADLHDGFALADIAHTNALMDAGYLPLQRGHELVAAIKRIAATPPEVFPYEPRFGDPWNCWFRVLRAEAGPDAEWLRVDRPRREVNRIAFRLCLRNDVAQLHTQVVDLVQSLLVRAHETRSSLMADTTYLQPAQPTTLGYLLVGHAGTVLRDAARLRDAFAWVNQSVAGAGGCNGSSLALDRDRMAELLGCDGVALHARDAMWQTDGLVDLLAVVASVGTFIGQLAADLEIWAAPQFGYVKLSGGTSRASALMPQKQNPYALAVVRSAGAVAQGALMTLLSTTRTGTARTDHYLLTMEEVVRAVRSVGTAVALLSLVYRDLEIDEHALARSAEGVEIGLADVAGQLMQQGRADYGLAHAVLGLGVRKARQRGSSAPTASDVNDAARELGCDLRLTGQELAQLSDPRRALALRATSGGIGPEHLDAVFAAAEHDWRTERRWARDTAARVRPAAETTIGRVS